jgi:hypothetical protein
LICSSVAFFFIRMIMFHLDQNKRGRGHLGAATAPKNKKAMDSTFKVCPWLSLTTLSGFPYVLLSSGQTGA